MQINILPIVTFLAVIQYINSKILKEVIQNEKYQITLSLENDEEIIDFKNNQNQSNDRIKCEIQPCQCYFIYQNEKSGQISNIQCKQNTITFFRTNTNLSIIQKENKYRITTETYTDNDMPNFKTISSGLTLKWKFNIDGTIEFATIWNKLTWLGIGFGSSMRNVDMITINVLGSTVGLIDLYSISDFTPPTDSSQDYTLISYQVGTSSVKTRFSRKLSTGDSKDKTLIINIIQLIIQKEVHIHGAMHILMHNLWNYTHIMLDFPLHYLIVLPPAQIQHQQLSLIQHQIIQVQRLPLDRIILVMVLFQAIFSLISFLLRPLFQFDQFIFYTNI